ncbi:hypothetical protein A2U01_0074655, partial [Trifolium medium]|nr:hypothetical protein [Trifolium medium]
MGSGCINPQKVNKKSTLGLQ